MRNKKYEPDTVSFWLIALTIKLDIHVISLENVRNYLKGKIEKVPRGIRGEKSSKDMASREIWSQQSEHRKSKIGGTEPGVRKGKHPLQMLHGNHEPKKGTLINIVWSVFSFTEYLKKYLTFKAQYSCGTSMINFLMKMTLFFFNSKYNQQCILTAVCWKRNEICQTYRHSTILFNNPKLSKLLGMLTIWSKHNFYQPEWNMLNKIFWHFW